MTSKLAIALGAVTRDSVTALIVAQGLGNEIPRVSLRPRGSDQRGTDLIPKPLAPGEEIAAGLAARGVRLFRVKAPVVGDVVLEA
jgi:hypothetical protein